MRSKTVLAACVFLAGCKVGPNYSPPCTELPQRLTEEKGTVFVKDEELVEWWSRFNDPVLNHYINLALCRNFDYRIALEVIYQARAQYLVNWAQIYPEFDATAIGSRYRTSQTFLRVPNPLTNTSSLDHPYQSFYQAGLDAIWELDLFGKYRRAAAGAYDLFEASIDDMRGVKISVISEVALTYATIASYQKKRQIAKEAVFLDKDILQLSHERLKAGLTDELEIERNLATIEADEAALKQIEALLKQSIYSLSILSGTLPEIIISEFPEDRPLLVAEGMVPSSLPGELLRRRPDICAAERRLAAATEQIGVAVADLFPSVSLTGSSSSYASNPLQGANVGYSSDKLYKLFQPASMIWGIGSLIIAPVFDFGKRNQTINVQVALRNQAYLTYQKTVIGALQETEQALETYFYDQGRVINLTKQVKANKKNLSLTTDRFQSGLVDYTEVLIARELWLTSSNTLVESQQTLAMDLIAIYKALGGDWS